jgi:hypothetical protein
MGFDKLYVEPRFKCLSSHVILGVKLVWPKTLPSNSVVYLSGGETRARSVNGVEIVGIV